MSLGGKPRRGQRTLAVEANSASNVAQLFYFARNNDAQFNPKCSTAVLILL